MSISLVTFANLGKKKNLPTADVMPVIDALVKSGDLTQIICQLHEDFYFKNTQSAVPPIVRYPVRIVEKLFRTTVSRRTEEALFDFFAQWRLHDATATFFHGGYFLPKTFRRAHAYGSITVDLVRTVHLETNAQIETKEIALLGLNGYQGNYRHLAHISKHCDDFDYVIGMSDFVKDSYIASGFPAERIFVAVPDIDTKRFVPQQHKSGKFRFLYMAHTTPLKGLHYLLEAWNALKLPNAELVIVGGFSDMPDALKARYEESIKNNPSIVRIQSTEFPEEQYGQASALVFPSLTEGFGRVISEAMASGLPVITTENAKALVEDGKTGFVVPIRDANALKEKMEYLYNHQDMAEQMGREGRRVIEQKKPFGESVLEIYTEILARERAGGKMIK